MREISLDLAVARVHHYLAQKAIAGPCASARNADNRTPTGGGGASNPDPHNPYALSEKGQSLAAMKARNLINTLLTNY